MTKSELISWLQEQNRQWQALLAEIDPALMEQPGVNGDWSMKDMVAHLTGWNVWLVDRMLAAQRGDPQPPPPWPEHLEGDDPVNAWIYQAYHQRSLAEVLAETDQLNRQILDIVESLPDDARVEFEEPEYYLVWIGDQRFEPGESFIHFRDDHEADVRAWMAQE